VHFSLLLIKTISVVAAFTNVGALFCITALPARLLLTRAHQTFRGSGISWYWKRPKVACSSAYWLSQSLARYVSYCQFRLRLTYCLDAVFNDVDEAELALDNIADGQLYRLRQAAQAGLTDRSHASRGGHRTVGASSSQGLRRSGQPPRGPSIPKG
jgi:hypothetical protein